MNNSNTSIIPGSLGAIAQSTGKSLAETFCQADAVVIVDVSYSMDTNDSLGGKSRYAVATEELTQLQKNLPGKIAVVSFSSSCRFNPNGVPDYPNGCTYLQKALNFVKIADVAGMKFILISDGEPDNPDACLAMAKTFTNKIDVIFVGPEDRPAGRNFLTKLSNLTGGTTVTASSANNLLSKIETLLLTSTATNHN